MQKSCFLKNYIWNLQVRRSTLNFFGNFCRCFRVEKIRQKTLSAAAHFSIYGCGQNGGADGRDVSSGSGKAFALE